MNATVTKAAAAKPANRAARRADKQPTKPADAMAQVVATVTAPKGGERTLPIPTVREETAKAVGAWAAADIKLRGEMIRLAWEDGVRAAHLRANMEGDRKTPNPDFSREVKDRFEAAIIAAMPAEVRKLIEGKDTKKLVNGKTKRDWQHAVGSKIKDLVAALATRERAEAKANGTAEPKGKDEGGDADDAADTVKDPALWLAQVNKTCATWLVQLQKMPIPDGVNGEGLATAIRNVVKFIPTDAAK